MNFYSNEYLHIKEKMLTLGESSSGGYMTEKMVSLPERLVKCIWYDQLLERARMKTADGRRIRVMSPGDWNLGPGPDFSSACFQIENDEPVYADVEIHVRAADWKRHGHHKNHEYSNVGLHVCMWNDAKDEFITAKNKTQIPQLILSSCLMGDLESIAAKVDMENYPFNSESRIGMCKGAAEQNPERTVQLIEMAARERFYLKARRYSGRLGTMKFDEALYLGIMEGLGYSRNKKPFRRLASLLPLKTIRRIRKETPRLERTLVLEAAYLGVSGLLSDFEVDMFDDEARAYLEALHPHWERLARDAARCGRMGKKEWTLRGVRPANFPVRRIAGAAALMARDGDEEFSKLVRLFAGNLKKCTGVKDMKKLLKAMFESLACEGEGYWANHMIPGGKVLEKVPSLVGISLSQTLVLNVVMPLLMGYAQLDADKVLRDRLVELFTIFPRLSKNEISKIMNYRMWGDTAGNGLLMKKESTQQGLIHVFFDFCDENIRDCATCAFPGMIRMDNE